jgi:hypothetical protein
MKLSSDEPLEVYEVVVRLLLAKYHEARSSHVRIRDILSIRGRIEFHDCKFCNSMPLEGFPHGAS